MTPGHKYFIENYIKIKKPDGTFSPVTLEPFQVEFLDAMEQAQKNGMRLTILKGRHRYGFGFVKSIMDKAQRTEP